MKLLKPSIILFILVLLFDSTLTSGSRGTRTMESRIGSSYVYDAEPLNGFHTAELSHIGISSAAASSSALLSSADDWHIETVGSDGDVGGDTSLALDGAGRPHIGYRSAYYHRLKYAWLDGWRWRIETVDHSSYLYDYSISLALDGSGWPYISYGVPGWGLKYASRSETSWQIEEVDSWGDSFTSLALDKMAQPHISYYFGVLKYAWYDGTDWHIEGVDGGRYDGMYTSLALDGTSRPHISYYQPMDYNLKYAWHDGVVWQVETVDSDGDVGEYTSLALDESGRPHISYYDSSNGDLKYAWHDGAVWRVETVDSDGDVGEYTSLALDESGRPHISYYDSSNGDLKYAWRDGAVWQIETVDSDGDVGEYTSLALDGSGRPHVSYYDSSNGDLKYASLMPPLLLEKQAVPNDGLYNKDALTYTLILSGPGLNVWFHDPLPDAVHYVSSSLTSTVIPMAVYSPTIGTIVWQGILCTDTAQVIRFQVRPDITGTGSLSLSVPVVNTAWLTDTGSGKSVSTTVIVNGRRVYLPIIMRNR